MEPLWSPAVATSGNRSQMGGRRDRLRQAKPVALGCDPLPESFYGKEGVDGSSPSEGSAKAPQICAFCFAWTCTVAIVRWVWSPLWSLQVEDPVSKSPFFAALASRASLASRPMTGSNRSLRTIHGPSRSRSVVRRKFELGVRRSPRGRAGGRGDGMSTTWLVQPAQPERIWPSCSLGRSVELMGGAGMLDRRATPGCGQR
jgi:hypothetical protein